MTFVDTVFGVTYQLNPLGKPAVKDSCGLTPIFLVRSLNLVPLHWMLCERKRIRSKLDMLQSSHVNWLPNFVASPRSAMRIVAMVRALVEPVSCATSRACSMLRHTITMCRNRALFDGPQSRGVLHSDEQARNFGDTRGNDA